jgi:hypothetical protein
MCEMHIEAPIIQRPRSFHFERGVVFSLLKRGCA